MAQERLLEFGRADQLGELVGARGSQRSTYSAPKIASAYAFMVRLMVAKSVSPPGRTMPAQAPTNASTSETCSTISMARTASNVSPAAASASAVVAR